jgi:DNA-binding NtrC family response regulator
MKPKILIIEDDCELANSHKDNLADLYEVRLAFDPDAGLALAKEYFPSLIILDLGFPSDVKVGMGLIPKLLEINPSTKIIVTTGFGDIEIGARSIESGAFNYIEKPIRDYHGFLVVIEQAFRIQRLEEEIGKLRAQRGREMSFFDLIGVSGAMQKIYESIKKVAPANTNVLILGETGTGKELVARAIHELGPRAKRPFIVVNCAAIPDTMLEDKLFGHERGAFTGAISKHVGALELAHEGDVFLDEIGEIEFSLQAKLLRFIQYKSFQRLGSNNDINVDVRIIAATNRNLESEVKKGSFREDLYYRLNVYPINIPPLKRRKEDIPLIVSHFLKEFSAQFCKKVSNIHPSAMSLLMHHYWPGNVRELENLIQRAILCADGDTILPLHLEGLGQSYGESTLDELCERYREIWIREAYARNFGDSDKTCIQLGMSKRQLQRYDRKFRIDRRLYEKR